MKVRVLGCSGGAAPGRNPSCYLLEGGVAIDAGALASALTLEEQQLITDIFLTHAHWDHVRDLPLTVINRTIKAPTLRLHGLPETVQSIRAHLMNGETWFKAFDLPSVESPFISASPMTAGETRECGRYRISAVSVPHTVPAISYVIDDGTCSVMMNADTVGGGIFERMPKDHSPLKAVFLEASFPNRMRDFAVMTGHLTPQMLGEETRHLATDVDVIVTHLKPGFETEMAREIADLGRPGIRPCRDGDVFEW
ncbi:MAG: 3',5'-cyclic-nucleotide phosphodiesterase [Planctomycetes bacterium]|nr:3',5'-cyclic-nucleotide phosphodiesterase [Planctomycetota bacterium]